MRKNSFIYVKIDQHDCVTGLGLDGSSVPFLLSQLSRFLKTSVSRVLLHAVAVALVLLF